MYVILASLGWFILSKPRIPRSIEQIRSVVNSCPICAECKPIFYKPTESHLIKATEPFETLNVDFKGPLPLTARTVTFSSY